MTLFEWAKKSIPAPDDIADVMHRDGDTRDIINTILYADSKLKGAMCKFASGFEKSYEGLYDLWDFVRQYINYIADEPGHERVKDPTVTWRDRSGDCKSFSLFIASILKCLQITYKYRFASYKDDDPTHVYIIATLNGREVILDATIDRFDSEVSYHKKWDKMTKITYLHGAGAPAIRTGRVKPSPTERLADAPRIFTNKPYINYDGMTEGGLTLRLTDELVKVLMNYFGDPIGIYQKARNIIYATSKDPHRISGHVGYIPEELYNLMPYIEYAKERSKPAGFASAHIGDLASDRALINESCRHYQQLYKEGIDFMFRYKKDRPTAHPDWRKYDGSNFKGSTPEERFDDLKKYVDNCVDQKFFIDIFNENLEGSSPHILYEFLDASTVQGTANFKANNHRLANSSMARYSHIDRTNIVLWQRLGITRAATTKSLPDISPEGLINSWRTGQEEAIQGHIGTPLIVALIPLFVAALGFAEKLLAQIQAKQAAFSSEVRGYSTKEFGPEDGDFKNSGFDFKSLLIPGALALGGIVLLNQK